MAELVIHPKPLNNMFAAMYKVGEQGWDVEKYFGDHVCSTAGFDYEACALKPLADAMPIIDGYFSDMYTYFDNKWRSLIDATYMSAKEVDLLDGEINWTFNQYINVMDAGSTRAAEAAIEAVPDLPEGALDYFKIEDLSLKEPEKGTRHGPAKFEAVADGWEAAISKINYGIGILNDLGLGPLEEIEEDLREYVVYPLAGNYGEIIANANACQVVDDAMQTWGANFGKLALQVPGAMEGEAALGLAAQLGLYDAVMRAIGFAIGEADVVYKGIAKVSDEIADVVEKVLVYLGQKLLKTASRFASKFVPGLGWASLAWDAIRGKLDDYVTDVVTIWKLINKCFDIIEEITDWAESCAEQLEKLEDLIDQIKLIPGVNVGGTLDDLSGDVEALKKKLQTTADYGNYATDKKSDLDDALEGLDGLVDE